MKSTVSDKAGVLHFTVDTSSHVIARQFSIVSLLKKNVKLQDFSLVPDSSLAYATYTYGISSGAMQVGIMSYVIDGNHDFTGGQLLTNNILGMKRLGISIANNGQYLYLAQQTDNGALPAGLSSRIGVYAINNDDSLSFEARVDKYNNNHPHSFAIDYDNALAYVTDPADGKIHQFHIGTDKGAVAPANQKVDDGTTATVTLSANQGYKSSAFGCGGAIAANSYTTGSITSDCTIVTTFVKQ